MNLSKERIYDKLYREMFRIRLFEETVLENFSKGVFAGTTHTYLGQEANAVGILSHIQPMDVVFSNHRCHGHFLASGGDMRALFAELMGRITGVCGGRGGSQHLQWGNFYSNGVQGGIVPVATGMALAEKFKNSSSLTVVFLGDGTLGEGVVYESLNMASLWGAPILFVLENNHIAQTTPSDAAVSGEIGTRFRAFGIPVKELASSDVMEIEAMAEKIILRVRLKCAPCALILHTQRFGPHSKGDDTRSAEEIEKIRQEHDPIQILAVQLNEEIRKAIESDVGKEVANAFNLALEDPLPSEKSTEAI